MNKITNELIDREIGVSEDNRYRAKLELRRTNLTTEERKDLEAYVKWHDIRIEVLLEEKNKT